MTYTHVIMTLNAAEATNKPSRARGGDVWVRDDAKRRTCSPLVGLVVPWRGMTRTARARSTSTSCTPCSRSCDVVR